MSKSSIGQIFNKYVTPSSMVMSAVLAAAVMVAADSYFLERDYGDVASCDLVSKEEVTPAVPFKGTGPRACQNLVKVMERAADGIRIKGSETNSSLVSQVRMHTANGGQRIVYVGPDGVLKAPPGME